MSGAVPEVLTENVAVWPVVIVWLVGWVVIDGAGPALVEFLWLPGGLLPAFVKPVHPEQMTAPNRLRIKMMKKKAYGNRKPCCRNCDLEPANS